MARAGAAALTDLIPPTLAIESLIFRGEPLTWTMMGVTLIVVIGLWLANRTADLGRRNSNRPLHRQHMVRDEAIASAHPLAFFRFILY